MRPKLKLQRQLLTVCRLEPDQAIPTWALAGSFFTVTRHAAEVAIACESRLAPKNVRRHGRWRKPVRCVDFRFRLRHGSRARLAARCLSRINPPDVFSGLRARPRS